ncbi:hypothetical protein DBV14_09270 [Variovorax sp. KBW07]|nr:hypothetical protein DBV14_09270 [Variovorax sp. KBW07]
MHFLLRFHARRLSVALLLACTLAACGGGGNSVTGLPVATPQPIPDTPADATPKPVVHCAP